MWAIGSFKSSSIGEPSSGVNTSPLLAGYTASSTKLSF